jgi:hypothetical protein
MEVKDQPDPKNVSDKDEDMINYQFDLDSESSNKEDNSELQQ